MSCPLIDTTQEDMWFKMSYVYRFDAVIQQGKANVEKVISDNGY